MAGALLPFNRTRSVCVIKQNEGASTFATQHATPSRNNGDFMTRG